MLILQNLVMSVVQFQPSFYYSINIQNRNSMLILQNLVMSLSNFNLVLESISRTWVLISSIDSTLWIAITHFFEVTLIFSSTDLSWEKKIYISPSPLIYFDKCTDKGNSLITMPETINKIKEKSRSREAESHRQLKFKQSA